MATTLTADSARQSLTEHLIAKGHEIHLKYGPEISWEALQRLLADRAYVRYPCEIAFDADQLWEGEFAHPVQKGETPEEGFVLYVHPMFATDLASVPALALYHLVVVNYGEFASADDAESFGAAALGLSRDEYYAGLCELADLLAGDEPGAQAHGGGCGGSCGCGH